MRKSQIEVATMLIIALAIAVILISAVASYLKSIESKGDAEKCRISVLASYKLGTATSGLDLVKNLNTKLRCTAAYNHLESNEKNANLAKKEVMFKIAEEMRQCWYKMGAGDVSFFNAVNEEPRICIMCSEFSLDRDIDVDELYEYLKNTNIPNTKEKYIEYFDTDFEYHEQWLAAYSPGLFSAGPRRAAGIKAVYDEIEQMKQKYGKMPQTFFFKVEAAGDVILDRNLIGSSAQAVKRKEANQYSVIYLRSAFSAWNKFFEIGVSKSQAPQQDFQTFMVLPKRDISRMVFDKEKMCEYLFYQTKDTGWLFR